MFQCCMELPKCLLIAKVRHLLIKIRESVFEPIRERRILYTVKIVKRLQRV
jgi:hypothetical protein